MKIEIYRCHKEHLGEGQPSVTGVNIHEVKCLSYTPRGETPPLNAEMSVVETYPPTQPQSGFTTCTNTNCRFYEYFSVGSKTEI